MTKKIYAIDFGNLDKDKITIIVEYDSERRKRLYQYLEQNHPTVPFTGLYSSRFHADFYATFGECLECDYKRVPLNEYHEGRMENNQDEYRRGTCPRCGESRIFETNFDDWDDIVRLHKHNIVVVGDYVKHRNRPTHAEDATENVQVDLSKKQMFEMLRPNKLISHKKLQKFIDEELARNHLGEFIDR